jgi:hypothetical protein
LTAQDPKVQAFQLKTQKQLTGEVLSVEGERVTLKVSMFGGTVEVQRDLTDFTPDSAYRIMASQTGNTFEDKMKLARFASEVDSIDYLRKEVRECYGIAEKAKNDAQIKEVSKFAADCIDKYFNLAMSKNDFAFAKNCINILMMKFPNERTPAQKKAMLDRYHSALDKVAADRKAAQEARAEKAAVDEANRLLKPLNDKIAQAAELENEGLLTGNNNIASRQKFDQAIDLLKEAYQKVQQYEKSSNKFLKDHASSLQVQIFDIGKDACLNAASAATFQSDYQGARGYINLVLAVDPHDKDALDARARVEMASSRGWW